MIHAISKGAFVPVADLLMEGVWLMLLGMGIVLAFLILLIFALNGMSRLAAAIDAKRSTATLPAASLGTLVSPELENEEELIAVISAAVTRYRATRR
jgi:oxaloacetate decarboxylase gamma subunit